MKKIITLVAIGIMLFQSNLVFALNLETIEAYGVDTVAGYGTILSTAKTLANVDIVFKVVKPDTTSFIIEAKTGKSGVATVNVSDYHTKKAGRYTLMARYANKTKYGASSYFDVFADKLSPEKSAISVDKKIAKADSSDAVLVKVLLNDAYSNPLKGHMVNLISSRKTDKIVSSAKFSNEQGVFIFNVSSAEEGLSVFSIYDVTENVVLNDRIQVAFINDLNAMGGTFDSLIQKAKAASSGPISRFEFSGLPSTINAGQNINFTLKAVDSDGLTVENYSGTVHFSAEGSNSSNVILPEDYTFKDSDLGMHEFALSLKFISNGTYKIVATDVSDLLIRGEKEVIVGTSGSSGSGSTVKPTITMPVAGTYGQDELTISGTASVSSIVKIYDNSNLMGSVQAGLDGKFSYQTGVLNNGTHAFMVKVVDSADTVLSESAVVNVTIDKDAPAVDDVVLEPSGQAEPGSKVNIKIYTEENLMTVAVIFDSDIYELTASLSDPSIYTGQLPMPSTEGLFSIDVVLVDQLNNEATYEGVAEIMVKKGAVSVPVNDAIDTVEPIDTNLNGSAGLPPSQVIGVIAYGSDNRVTLVWEAATDDEAISKYRINYGLLPSSLNNQVDTVDSKTTWYIPSLENGKEYYFSVFAIDNEGNESVSGSMVVSAIPFTLEVENALPERPSLPLGVVDNEVLLKYAALEGIPSELVRNGPELIWLLFGTGVLSGVSRKLSKKKNRK
jgi:hypothetical protein